METRNQDQIQARRFYALTRHPPRDPKAAIDDNSAAAEFHEAGGRHGRDGADRRPTVQAEPDDPRAQDQFPSRVPSKRFFKPFQQSM